MSFVPRVLASLAQGALYSGMVGAAYTSFVDHDWNLQNQLKLTGFWVLFAVPYGIGWSSLNKFIFSKIGSRPEMVWNLAIWDKKAILTDFLLNQVIFQGGFVLGFFEYAKRVFNKEESQIKQDAQQPEEIKTPEPKKDVYSEENLKELAIARLKITLASYFIDLWGPWISDAYLKNKKFRNVKDLLLAATWHTFVVHKFFHPGAKVRKNAEEKPKGTK